MTTNTAPLDAEALWLLAELERLEKEATPRPWRVEEKAILGPDIDGLESVVWDERSWDRGEHYSPTKTQAVANAKIATNLRNHLPQIITALRSLAEMREALEECRHFIAGEYCSDEASAMQGHPIDKGARPVWDRICTALSKTQERKG